MELNKKRCELSNQDEMKATTLTLAILAAVVILACSRLSAQEKSDEELRREYEGLPWDKAHVEQTEHYTVRCNSTREITKRYAELLEKLFVLYNETFPNLATKEMKWEAWIYSTRSEFQQRHANRREYTAGFYWPGDRRIYTYHGLFGVSGSTFTILAHEGTHAFQHLFLKSYFGTPTWLLEGMAVLFEGIEVDGKGKLSLKKPPRDRLLQVKLELKEKKGMKLADIAGVERKEFSRRSYAYAGLLVWWLAKTGAKQRAVLDELLQNLRERSYQKGELDKLLQKHLGKDLAGAEKEWRSWVLRQKVEYTGRKKPGDAYSSKLLKFSIKRPGSDWKMDADRAPVEGECVVYKRSRSGGRISVTAYANQLPLGADELYFQFLRDLKDQVQGLKVQNSKRVKHGRYPGFQITYSGSEPKSRITREVQKVRLAVIVAPHHIYVVRMQSPPEKWSDNEKGFEQALENLKISR
jgi:hypothetical protein